MNRHWLRRRLGRKLVLTLTLAATTAAAVVFSPAAPAQAASSIGGKITRSEVLARAANWYLRRNDSDMTYSMELKTWDGTHSRTYRRDCSGLVDMAWHLGDDPNTHGLDDPTYTTPISRSELLPGDLLDDTVNDDPGYPYHALLFGGWEDAAKTKFWYYSFGGTPMKKEEHKSFSDATLSGHATWQYKAYRYNKIVNDLDDDDPAIASVTGDGFHDIVARKSDNSLWLYPNNYVRDGGVPYSGSTARQIGSGWGNFNSIVGADVTGDGFTDLVVRKTVDNSLWLYSNNYVRDDGVPYSAGSSRQIGSGWGNFNLLVGADVTGDGFTDLVGRTTDGSLWLYPNNFVRDDGIPYSSSSARQIGSGWGNFNRIIGADVTGDGFTDLVGRKADGSLWLYPNNYVRDGGVPYSSSSARQIGSGWNNFDTIIGADVTGDGFTDLVGRKADESLWLYPNNYVRDGGVPYSGSTARQIGSGWGNFNTIL
ncbi:FG-GAP-like repeat-containing protein [Asanoa sp. NPDC049518]|uniref:FG-GAP-like repeat-containing protein n=1 Tax=unclassified Asanoa TaxID=2685164 RepID=UPI00342030A6